MPQIVEGQIFDRGRLADPLKGLGHRLWAIPYTLPSIRRGGPSGIVSAVGGSGTSLGVPFLVSGRNSARPSISKCFQRIAVISPQRIAVSIAQVMRGADLPAVSPGGCQEADLLVADQTSVAARGQAGFLDKFCGVIQPLHAPIACGPR